MGCPVYILIFQFLIETKSPKLQSLSFKFNFINPNLIYFYLNIENGLSKLLISI